MNRRRLIPVLPLLLAWLFLPETVMADNCGSLSDCFASGRSAIAAMGALGALGGLVLGAIPGIGTIKGIIEGLSGRDLITGEPLSNWDRFMGIVPGLGALGGLRRGDRLAGVLDSLGNIYDVGRNREGFGDALTGGFPDIPDPDDD